MQFLLGLNDVYQNIRSNILARDPIPYVREAFNVVYREESHRGLYPRTGSGSGNKVQPAAFVVKSNNFRRNEPRRGGNYVGNSNGKVYNKNTEAPKGPSTSSGSTSFDTQFKKEQMMKVLSLINDKPLGNVNANMAGMRPTFFNGNVLFNVHFEKFFCAQTCSYMYNLTLGLNLTVDHPNGTLVKIYAIGSLRLTANVVLFDLLVIPDYNVSLMSVHKLIKDSKLFVGFDETKCYIQDLNLVKALGTGSEADGLLGHPADHVLSVLSKYIGLKYEKHVSPCDICHKAKQTREPFPLSNHKSLSVRDLIHLDLWGPYRVVSRDGYKDFLTIVDDYSRAVWAYLIKSKDKASLFYLVWSIPLLVSIWKRT
nr:ribonuclease H-like domain-containing protein [Tanacetum cinerariifolium]